MSKEKYNGHTPGYCEQCHTTMLYCKTCGNNNCNGGYGTVDGTYNPDSDPCPDCPDCYDQGKHLPDYTFDNTLTLQEAIEEVRKLGIENFEEDLEKGREWAKSINWGKVDEGDKE